jgi:hypothetical protein
MGLAIMPKRAQDPELRAFRSPFTLSGPSSFFDQNPQVPALLLFVADGDMTRSMTGGMSRESCWGEGPRRIDSMTEAMVVLVLARRDRVDALRPFAPHATGDRNAQFHTERDLQLHAARAVRRAALGRRPLPQPGNAPITDDSGNFLATHGGSIRRADLANDAAPEQQHAGDKD